MSIFRALCALKPDFYALVFSTALLFGFALQFNATNVGDGAEYYAMEVALAQAKVPYMTDSGWQKYQRLRETGEVAGLEPTGQLKKKFPALRVGSTSDFNHFWAYSLAGAVSDTFLPGGAHIGFMALHAALFLLLVCISLRTDGRMGAVAATALLLTSPMLWFLTKVHTEWWTATLSTAAFICAFSRKWAFAALLFSLVSTQNISFALPAAFCWIIGAYDFFRIPANRLSNSALLILSAIIVLVHPWYYFARYGVVTPQLLAGGADLNRDFTAFRYLIDPDIGLFPNWPLGLLLLGVSVFYLIHDGWERLKANMGPVLLVLVYCTSALWAHNASQNMNSGATVHLARYGLWYLPLFYFPLLRVFKSFDRPHHA
ncbi:hypothetical protein [Lysobacter soyae]|uniref:Glycosyltransferase RgtA/B/C/D-like domain-containing protein n=1 Tax=Lysobacter soyae TaxID=2764185 RepID=A0ABX8WQ43_9GAMM|nr:hypothetical protein [Lysobacter sp. CJ11]QYR52733.1 hypothetical protein H8L67_09135 [Lysobacter sp. CJ11]